MDGRKQTMKKMYILGSGAMRKSQLKRNRLAKRKGLDFHGIVDM